MKRRYLAPCLFLLAVAFASLPLSVARLRGQTQPRNGVIALKGATILTVTRRHDSERHHRAARRQDRRGRRERAGARRRGSHRRHRQVRLAGPDRLPLAHRRRRHQREQPFRCPLDGRHADVLDPDRHHDLPRSRRRRRRRPTSCTAAPTRSAARRRHQAALGQGRARGARVPGRAAGHQVRPGREPQAPATGGGRGGNRRRASRHAHGRRRRDPRRLHARQGLPESWQEYERRRRTATRMRSRRAATCSSNRSSRSSRASGWSTRTATAPTRS